MFQRIAASFQILTSATTLAVFCIAADASSAAAADPDPTTTNDFEGIQIQGKTCIASQAVVDKHQAYTLCRKVLLPRQPAVIVQTPGSFIVGRAWGAEDSAIVFGPAVGLGATVRIPVDSPNLVPLSLSGGAKWQRPTEMSFIMNWDVGLNAGLTGLKIDVDDETLDSTQLGFTAGLFTGPEIGFAWFPDGETEKSVVLTLGVLAAYLGSVDGLGDGGAFLLGFQPSLIISL